MDLIRTAMSSSGLIRGAALARGELLPNPVGSRSSSSTFLEVDLLRATSSRETVLINRGGSASALVAATPLPRGDDSTSFPGTRLRRTPAFAPEVGITSAPSHLVQVSNCALHHNLPDAFLEADKLPSVAMAMSSLPYSSHPSSSLPDVCPAALAAEA